MLRGFQIDSQKDAYEMNDDTSTYISESLSFVTSHLRSPGEKKKKKESHKACMAFTLGGALYSA